MNVVVPAKEAPGGLLALPSNIGRFSRDRFGLIPEVNLNVGYQLTDHLRLFVGYDILYWSNVVRPGDQISRSINPTQQLGGTLMGVAAPLPQFHTTDFWAQGVSLGLDLQF